MPIVCRNRPNRSKPRKLNPAAAARIVCATMGELRDVPTAEFVGGLRGKEPSRQYLAALQYAKENPNWTQADIEAEIKRRCDWESADCAKCEKKAAQAVAVAQQMIEANNRTLAIADAVLQALELAGRGIIFGLRFAPLPPVVRVAIPPLTIAVGRVGQVRGTIRATRAANDDAFRLVANL